MDAAKRGAAPMDAPKRGAAPMPAPGSLGPGAKAGIAAAPLMEVARTGAPGTAALRAVAEGLNLPNAAPTDAAVANRGTPAAVRDAAPDIAAPGGSVTPLFIDVMFDTGAKPALRLKP